MTFYATEIARVYKGIEIPEYIYDRIRDSKHFMETHFHEPINLNEIAAAACLSRFHYVRQFRRIYGVTPRDFLRDIRINAAKILLAEGLDATTVCNRVGYDSLPTFSTAFKKGTGYPPGMFQILHKSNLE
jgi:AraC-like DNA-binding protein